MPASSDGQAVPERQLARLSELLGERGYITEHTVNGMRLVAPGSTGCCSAAGRHRGDLITWEDRVDDGGRPWFLTSWRHPIAPVSDLTRAATAIIHYLG